MNVPIAYAINNPRNTYEVKTGDNLWKIANTYRTTVQDLKLINGLQSDVVYVGQKIRVPIMYEVVRGDTIWGLSQEFNSTVQLIKTANVLKTNTIYTGQRLRVPPKRLIIDGKFVRMTRDEFRDWLFNQVFTRRIRKIQLHHTWDPSYKDFNGSNHFTLVKEMEQRHVKEMGWSQISQQLTTFPDGTVVAGRPINTPPEGSFGLLNKSVMHQIEADALAIENVGNFDIGNNQMTAEQRETIITVTALLNLRFGLTPTIDSVTYHHWWDINTGERVLDNSKGHAVKSCPGTGFFGGNSTTNAKSNFYPLVLKRMQELSSTMP